MLTLNDILLELDARDEIDISDAIWRRIQIAMSSGDKVHLASVLDSLLAESKRSVRRRILKRVAISGLVPSIEHPSEGEKPKGRMH
jgi:hypothetical protein